MSSHTFRTCAGRFARRALCQGAAARVTSEAAPAADDSSRPGGAHRGVRPNPVARRQRRDLHLRLAKLAEARVEDGVVLEALEEEQRARRTPVRLVDGGADLGRLPLPPADLCVRGERIAGGRAEARRQACNRCSPFPRARCMHAWAPTILWLRASRAGPGRRTTPLPLPTTTSAVKRIRLPPFVTCGIRHARGSAG